MTPIHSSYDLMHVTGVDHPSIPDREEWFGKCDTEEAGKAFAVLQRFMDKHGRGAALQRTPTGSGRSMLLRYLPVGRRYPQLSDESQKRIRAWSFPHRMEFLSPPGRRKVRTYDARVAFAACCADVPCFFPADFTFDCLPMFAGYQRCLYTVDVMVPRGWEHIGLVPKRPELHAPHWLYPRRGGEEWQAHLWQTEVQLLIDHDWKFAIRDRMLFAQESGSAITDPLRAWVSVFNQFLDEGKLPTDVTGRLVRKGLRAMVLNTIGAFHGNKSWVPVGDDTPLGAERRLVDGTWQAATYETLHDRRGMWSHPEWSSHIWAKARVKTTKQALLVPFGRLVRINGDGIDTTDDLGWRDSGKVGAYRLKE